MLEASLIRRILAGYSLPVMGIHGLPHWARVMETGRKLARRTGADPRVVALFAVFHDARRRNDGWDPNHGRRGGELAVRLRGALDLTEDQLELLTFACIHHTEGLTDGDVTVQTCWDADRLDLWRVGIEPSPSRLCTGSAREPVLMTWARERSRSGSVPAVVTESWLAGAAEEA